MGEGLPGGGAPAPAGAPGASPTPTPCAAPPTRAALPTLGDAPRAEVFDADAGVPGLATGLGLGPPLLRDPGPGLPMPAAAPARAGGDACNHTIQIVRGIPKQVHAQKSLARDSDLTVGCTGSGSNGAATEREHVRGARRAIPLEGRHPMASGSPQQRKPMWRANKHESAVRHGIAPRGSIAHVTYHVPSD